MCRKARGGLTNPQGLQFVSDGSLIVASEGTNDLVRYNPASTASINGVATGLKIGLWEDSFNPQSATAPGFETIGPDGYLYVSNTQSNSVLRYNTTTGELMGTFVPSGSGGLVNPQGLGFDAKDGFLYVVGQDKNGNWLVYRYSGTTGSYVDQFVPATGLIQQGEGITFDASGNVYVASFLTNQVLKYSDTNGAYLGAFVTGGSGGLNGPTGIAFYGSYLYVGSYNTDSVLRYSSTSGVFSNIAVSPQSGGLDGPTALIFDASGNLYVSSGAESSSLLSPQASAGSDQDNRVLEYKPGAGNVPFSFTVAYVSRGLGGLSGPDGLAFSNGNLLVASRDTDQILKYTATGATAVFVAPLDLSPIILGIAFDPNGNGDVNGDGVDDLFAAANNLNSIQVFDGVTGEYVETFVAPGYGGLKAPTDILFHVNSTGDTLYVSSSGTNQVLMYNALTGAYEGVAAQGNGLSAPDGLVFDSNGNLYVASSGSNSVLEFSSSGAFIRAFVTAGSGGLLSPRGLTFTAGASPMLLVTSFGTSQVLAYNGSTGAFIGVYNNSQSAAFTDPTSLLSQNDAYSGNVYVAYATRDLGLNADDTDVADNLNAIALTASSDGGNSFSPPEILNDTKFNGTNLQRDAQPKLTISQGRLPNTNYPGDPGVPAGQVTAVWDDFGTNNFPVFQAEPDYIYSDNVQAGTTYSTTSTYDVSNNNATIQPAQESGAPVTTDFPLSVNISDSRFTTVGHVDVRLSLYAGAPDNDSFYEIDLVGPNGTRVPLVRNANLYPNNTGAIGVTGQGFGYQPTDPTKNPDYTLDTVFDDEAARAITNGLYADAGNTTDPYVGTYSPDVQLASTVNGVAFPAGLDLSSFIGLSSAAINGVWKLEITNFAPADPTGVQPPRVLDWGVDISSNLTGGKDALVSATNVWGRLTGASIKGVAESGPYGISQSGVLDGPALGAVTEYTSVQPQGIGPDPVIASDNTLGSFSPYQGRIYVAYVDQPAADLNGSSIDSEVAGIDDNTDIMLRYSDDGGTTWSTAVQVNDDNSVTDGYSAAINTDGLSGGRPQYEPQVAVDPSTGTLALSFYDTRNDPQRARVATYIAISEDGGTTFAPETFANAPQTAVDGITGKTVVLGPIPDNQSPNDGVPYQGNLLTDTTYFSYGDHQGLAFLDGRLYPVWSSNENDGTQGNLSLDIRATSMTVASGPRIVASTMGTIKAQTVEDLNGNSISFNNATASGMSGVANGTPLVNGFVIQFDRPVDPSTVNASDILVTYRNVTTSGFQTGVNIPVTTVTPLGGPGEGNTNQGPTEFLVQFAAQGGVGTYSYQVGPTVRDRVRTVTSAGVVQSGNLMDQNGDAIGGENPYLTPFTGTSPGDVYAVPTPAPTTATTFAGTVFDPPYDETTQPLIVPGPSVISTYIPGVTATSNNLVTDQTVSQLAVVFDRDMNPATLTAGSVLRIMGPQGVINGPFSISPIPVNGDAERTFSIGFPAQQLSGTYTVTFASTIQSSVGDALDTNQNAGLDELQGQSSTGQTTTITYNSADAVAPIIGGAKAGTATYSYINVPDNFIVGGVTLTINLTYPHDPDLTAFLISPSGVADQLFTGVGSTGSQANFTNTTFSDSASTPIQNGGPPFFSGTSSPYNPQFPLSIFKNEDSGGKWALEVVDSKATTPLTSGTINSWQLNLVKPVTATGLGETVADQYTASFQIFTQDPTNSLSSNTWTSVGSSGIGASTAGGNAQVSGQVGAIAVDPSDPSGNTVYLGAASGGIWKTNDFLTTSAAGPTWVPLTNFGPTSSLNIGSIAVFARNNDPNQSIIIAGTGNGDSLGDQTAGTPAEGSSPSLETKGVGFLRSMDGGATWTLLDSSTNVDASGNPLPVNSPLRDHIFDNTTTFKVVVDPKLTPSGGVIIYAALSDVTATGQAVTGNGTAGGIWRSVDSGNTWTKMLAGQATDVLLDQNSGTGAPGGNLQIVYAAIQGVGVYSSPNRGQVFNLMAGTAGDPLIQNADDKPTQPVAVGASVSEYYPKNPASPNSLANAVKGRIVLAKPALTGNPLEDTLYQGWLYAAVVTSATTVTADSQLVFGGHLEGLYLTKDFGQNWTRVLLPTEDTDTMAAGDQSLPQIPTNDDRFPDYNPLGNNTPAGVPIPPENDPNEDNYGLGNYAISLAVDPNNPNVVYLGGSSTYDTSGLLRIDTTGIADAHAFYMSNTDPEGVTVKPANYQLGGQTTNENNSVPIPVSVPQGPIYDYNPTAAQVTTPGAPFSPVYTPYVNLIANPLNPFETASTILTTSTGEFTNDGSKAKWTTFDQALQPSTFDTNPDDSASVPTTNVHQILTMVDPITGKTRLIFGDDNGVFTAVDDGNGTLVGSLGSTTTLSTTSGNVQVPTGSRNGNISDMQFYYGSAEPSNAAAKNSPNAGMFYATTHGDGLVSSNANEISKGQTGYGNTNWISDDSSPSTGNVPRSTGAGIGVVQTSNVTGGNYGGVYDYTLPGAITNGKVTDFFQLDGTSRTSGLFLNQNAQYDPVAKTGIADVPDAEWPFLAGFKFSVNPINGSQVLLSSENGTVFSTENGGEFWNVIGNPNALDGTNAQALAYGAPDPNGPGGVGNQDAYLFAGTVSGNIFVTFTGGGSNGNTWLNLSSGLDGSPVEQIITNPTPGSHEAYAVTEKGVYHMVNSAAAGAKWVNITANLFSIVEPVFGSSSTTEDRLLDLTSIQADWRYVIPDSFANPTGTTHPMLYVAGEGGVFRSYDGGLTWTIFPSAASGSLDTTPTSPGDGGGLPNALITSLDLDLGEINPANGRANVATGPNSLYATTYGSGAYSIRLAPIVFPTTVGLDATNPTPGGSDTGLSSTDMITDLTQPYISGLSEQTAYGNVVTITLYDESVSGEMIPIGTGTTDAAGHFSVQVSVPFTTDGVKVIGIQATDQSGTKGNVTTFTFTLVTATPATPIKPSLDAALPAPGGSDSGQTRLPATLTDDITNVTSPYLDVLTTSTGGTIPATSEIFLYSDGGAKAIATRIGPGVLHDTRVLAAGVHTYYAVIEDLAGNLSQPSATLTITVITKALGPQTTAPVLDPASDSGTKLDNITNVVQPTFDVTPVFSPSETTTTVELLRKLDGSTGAFTVVGLADLTNTTSPLVVQDTTGVPADGKYDYEVEQIDVAGNVSAASPFVIVTIDTTPQGPPLTPVIQAGSVTGPVGSNTTADLTPYFNVTAVDTAAFPSVTVELLRKVDGAAASTYVVVGTAPATGNVTVAIQDILGSRPVNGKYDYAADEIDVAGNRSGPSGFTVITFSFVTPPPPVSLVLDAGSDSGVKGDNITNVTSPFFDVVTSDTGSTVNLYRKVSGAADSTYVLVGSRVGTGTVQDIVGARPVQGSYVYTAQEVSSTGITGPFLTTPLTVRFLTTAEGPPQAPVLDPASDSGTKGDNITNVTSPSFDVTAVTIANEPASPTMELVRKVDGAPLSSYVVVGGPSVAGLSALIQDKGPVPTNGKYDYAAIEIDVAGNASAPGNFVVITIQTTTPIQPVISLSPASDSGVQGDHITNVAQPTFLGTTSPNASVTLYEIVTGGGLLPLATTSALASGAFTITPTSKFNEGSYKLEAIATDSAGNQSTSVVFPLQILITPPGTPPAPILDPVSDSGSSSSDDFTNVVSPYFRETASSATTTVQLYRKLQGTADTSYVLIGSATGNASFGYSLIQDPGPVVPPGKIAVYVYAAKQIDVAGNVGSFGPSTAVTFDTVSPVAPIAPTLDPSTDSGVLGDETTNVNKNDVFDVTTTAPTNTFILYRTVAGSGVNTVVGKLVGSGKITDTSLLSDGTYMYFAQQSDLAGNVGPVSPIQNVTIKTIAPSTPAPFVLNPADDSGLIGDNVTNVVRPRFTGTTTAGASVVLLTPTGPISAAVTAAANGSFSVQPSVALASGVYTITAQATDYVGNKSLASQAITLTIDTAPPTVPTIAILASDVTGLPGTNMTTVVRPHFIGVTDPNTKVVLTIGSQTVTGSSNASGTYSLQPTANLAYGTYTAQVQASDIAGNISTSSQIKVTIAATVPTSPTIALLASDDSGVQGDNITNVNRPHLTGVAGINLKINLFDTSGKLYGTTTTDATGNYSVQPTTALADGAYGFFIQAYNSTTSANSGAILVTISTKKPASPPVAIFSADDTGVIGDFVTAVRTPRFVGTTVANSTIGLYDVKTGTLLAAQAVGSSGSYTLQAGSLTGTPLPLGTDNLEIIVTDVAGNVSSPSIFQVNIIKAPGDFDGDGKTDAAAFDPGSSTFYYTPSSGGATKSTVFGVGGSVGVPVAGDFDGDGKTDLAEYDRANSTFYILYSGGGAAAIQLGTTGHGDIPDPGDFFGTGKTNIAVYDPTLAQFQIYNPSSPTQPTIVPWGIANRNEVPVPGDFNGDGKTDFAVYDQGYAEFLVEYSSGGSEGMSWGIANRNEVPVAGDFDGDGKTDFAVYDQGYATMLIDYSSGGSAGVGWGIANRNDIPTYGDYTGNGKTDVAVYDQGYSTLLVSYSTGGSQGFGIGLANRNDIPQPSVLPTSNLSGGGLGTLDVVNLSGTNFQPLSSAVSSSVAIAPATKVRLHAPKKAPAKVKSLLTKAEHAKVVAAKVKVTAHDLALESLWDRHIGE